MDSSQGLAQVAARWLERAVASGEEVSLAAVAARLGVTDRHLRRIFLAAHGVSPHDYLTTQRLLLAKRLLTDTDEAVSQVALASGFASLRRFNAAFVERYRMAPTRLRREGGATTGAPALRLAWRPPYDVEGVLGFLARRQVRGIEQVEGPVLRRTLAIERRGRRADGWIEARFDPERHEVRLEVSPSLGPVLGAVIERLRHALDLDADPARIDPVLSRLPVPPRAGTRVPGAIDGFEVAVRAILGQQVSVAVACTLAARLVERFGTPLATPFPALTHVFPTPATLAAADPDVLGRIGIVRQRARALQALAAAVAEGRLELHRGSPLEPTLATLRALPGVGEWTTQVIAMRALGWPDAWPGGDAALAKALGTRDPLAIEARARPWRPWRAYAVMRLWQHQESS